MLSGDIRLLVFKTTNGVEVVSRGLIGSLVRGCGVSNGRPSRSVVSVLNEGFFVLERFELIT